MFYPLYQCTHLYYVVFLVWIPLATHHLAWDISSMDCGRGFPKVSGRRKEAKAVTKVRLPRMMYGRNSRELSVQRERSVQAFKLKRQLRIGNTINSNLRDNFLTKVKQKRCEAASHPGKEATCPCGRGPEHCWVYFCSVDIQQAYTSRESKFTQHLQSHSNTRQV